MSFINNIQSVAKYESKILIRSWFFKVFMVLAILILGFFDFGMLVADDGGGMWMLKALPSNLPYVNLLLLNTGQAVICIFLASEFLKRDKKLDTSEVFYVRPLSNAEYVIGKIWGNLRVFLILNLIVMGMALIFNLITSGMAVDWGAYLLYFFLISIPTLVFIIGLSIFLMLVLKNQALTFIILLGYIGLTLFYISDKFYYLFDYMAYSLPLVKSGIVGFTNWETVLNHRAIYFFAGLAFIFFTIFLFRRLPNSSRSNYPWLFLSFCMLLISGAAGYKHVHSILGQGEMRTLYTEVNNKYVHTPKMIIEQYDILLEQQPETFVSEVTMKGLALEPAAVFTFCLNPGLQVQEIKRGGNNLDFKRDNQILLVDFGQEIVPGDTVTFSVKYGGKIDSKFCYLDIPAEVLQKEYRNFLFNIDKQYVFQTDDYLLFTPETYWYPRPGTSYSNMSPDWQQTYFSKFGLQVKPLPGLTPLSQGEGVKEEDGSYSFTPEYPVQAISLIVGKYKQQSLESDSTVYSIWHIEGNDYYTATFDSILDTIPSFVRNMRENLERTYRLSYPFNRFSVIEVPVQFSTYTRAWSQAQEAVQPEMVLFPEKGCVFGQLDVDRAWRNQIKWSKRGGREITEEEAKIRALNNFFWIFQRPEGNYNFSSAGRGNYNISSQANPYFLFPQLYNYRYNIFSPDWPVANAAIELYLQKKSDNYGWERDINGISNNEKASLLMEKQGFKELLANVEYRNLLENIVSLKVYRLFADPEISIGVNAFRDSVYALLEKNTFRNIQFESLLDTLGNISHTDIRSGLSEWSYPTPLPYYTLGRPEVTRITNRGQEVFVLKMQVSNNSDHDGIVHIDIQGVGRRDQNNIDPRTSRKIPLTAHQTKELVSVWEEAPRDVTVNTLISGNLPSVINQPVGNIKQERRQNIDTEGDFIVSTSSQDIEGEIIVDNEDTTLFVLSEPDVVGMLPKWLDKVEDTSFKYSGVSDWRPPLQWTATTNANYYGKYIRSAYVIKSGNGSQTATWKIPVPAEGQYDVYYYVSKNNEMRYNDRAQGEYRFKVKQGEETEDAYIDLRKANEGWEQLGVYYFVADTAFIVLTNECKLRSVTADAVKLVKR